MLSKFGFFIPTKITANEYLFKSIKIKMHKTLAWSFGGKVRGNLESGDPKIGIGYGLLKDSTLYFTKIRNISVRSV